MSKNVAIKEEQLQQLRNGIVLADQIEIRPETENN